MGGGDGCGRRAWWEKNEDNFTWITIKKEELKNEKKWLINLYFKIKKENNKVNLIIVIETIKLNNYCRTLNIWSVPNIEYKTKFKFIRKWREYIIGKILFNIWDVPNW